MLTNADFVGFDDVALARLAHGDWNDPAWSPAELSAEATMQASSHGSALVEHLEARARRRYSRHVANQPFRPYYAPAALPAFIPLGWRTHLVAGSIACACLSNFLLDGLQLAIGKQTQGADPALGPLVAVGIAGLGVLVTLILGAVFFGIFIVRAAHNLRALGRVGMEFTPGWCIGWFFVPFANLVKPVKAFTEVWKASDPHVLDSSAWRHEGRGDPRIGVWWGSWIASSMIGNVSGRIDDPAISGMVGLVGTSISTVAGIFCCLLVYQLAARQNEAAARILSGVRAPVGV